VRDQAWFNCQFPILPSTVVPPAPITPPGVGSWGVLLRIDRMRSRGVDPAWCDLLERGCDLMLHSLPDTSAPPLDNYSSIGSGPKAVCSTEAAEAMLLEHIRLRFAELCVDPFRNPLGAVFKPGGGARFA
jgi:hypothetical protein